VSDIIAYTDGGCRQNPGGLGAWAFVLIDRESKQALERADASAQTTSNRMEIQAVLEAFSALRRARARVLVLSDSKYVINCCSKWMPAWKRLGWQRKDGPLKNVDLLQRLDESLAQHAIDWRWVPGHSGETGNERADQLVNEAMDRLLRREQAAWERRCSWQARLPSATVLQQTRQSRVLARESR
jgi:ribonuclease HI